MICFDPYNLKISFTNEDIVNTFAALIAKTGNKVLLNQAEFKKFTDEKNLLKFSQKLAQFESATLINYWFLAELLALCVFPEDQHGWKFAPLYVDLDGHQAIDLWSQGQPPRIQSEDIYIIFLKLVQDYNATLIARCRREIERTPDDADRVARYEERIKKVEEQSSATEENINKIIDELLLSESANPIEFSYTNKKEKVKKNGFS